MTRSAQARRIAAFAVAAIAVVTSAVGPARLAEAVGLTQAAPTPSSAVGYLPEATPVRVQSPKISIDGLQRVQTNQPITLADGSQSPSDTVLLRFSAIRLKPLQLSRAGAGGDKLLITNSGTSDANGAVIGGPGDTVTLWGRIRTLDICLQAQVVSGLIGGLPVVGGLLGGIVDNLANVVDGLNPLANVCPSLTELLPVLDLATSTGIALPTTINAANLDIDVYALTVEAPDGTTSLDLPLGQVVLTS